MKTVKKAQNGKTTPSDYWSKIGKKVGDTKIKDIPEKTVRVAKRVGKKLVDKLPEAAETTANFATAGYYGKAKRAMGGKYKGKKNGGAVSYKSAQKAAGYKSGGKVSNNKK